MRARYIGPYAAALDRELDQLLEWTMVRLLRSRPARAPVTYYEVALAVGGEAWPALIKRAGAAARRLAERGWVERVKIGIGQAAVPTGGAVRLRRGVDSLALLPPRISLN